MPKYYRIAGHGVAEFPDSLSDAEIERYIAEQQRQERQQDVSYGTAADTAMGFLGKGAAQIGTGLAKAAEQIPLVGESFGSYLRELSEADKEKFLGLAEMPGSKAAEVGGMLGTTGGLMAMRMAPVVGQGLAAAAGAGLGAEEARDRQIRAMIAGKEISPEAQTWGQLGGAALGASEYFNPAGGFSKLAGLLRSPAARVATRAAADAKAIKAAEELAGLTWKGIAKEGAKQFGTEALQEGGQELGQNLLEKWYNPEKAWHENVPTSMLLGGVMGGALGVPGALYGRHLARRAGFGAGTPGLGGDEGMAVDTTAPAVDLLGGARAPAAGDAFGIGHIQPQQPGAVIEQLAAELRPPSAEAQAAALPAPPAQPDWMPSHDKLAQDRFGKPYEGLTIEQRYEVDKLAWDLATMPESPAQRVPEPEAQAPAVAAAIEEQLTGPESFAEQEKLMAQRLSGLLGAKPAQSLVGRMVAGIRTVAGGEADARYIPGADRAIEIAFLPRQEGEGKKSYFARMSDHVGRLVNHEFVHFLKESGVFTPQQWKVLARKAKSKLLPEAQELYGDQPGYTPEKIEEESVANLFGDSALRSDPKTFVGQMWRRTINVLGRTGNAFRGLGWQTADDVMASIRRGELAQQRPYAEIAAERAAKQAARQAALDAIPIAPGEGAHRREAMAAYAAGEPERQRIAAEREAGREAQRQAALAAAPRIPGEGAAKFEARAAYATGEPERQRVAAEREARRQAEIAAIQPGPIGPTAGTAQRAAQAAYAAQAPAREAAEAAAAERRAAQIASLPSVPVGPGEGAAKARARAEARAQSDRYGQTVTGQDGREYVWDKQQGGWAPAPQEMYALPIQETDHQRRIREGRGYTRIEEVDAKKFQDAFEAARGEKLSWHPERPKRLKDLPYFDAYPQVVTDWKGDPDVLDGRHRIAEAARRGERIQVATNPDSPPLPMELYALFRGRNKERLPNAIDDPDTVSHEFEMSGRNARAVRPRFKGEVLESALGPDILTTGYESASREEEPFVRNVVTAAKAVNFQDMTEEQVLANPHGAAREMISRMKENLLWLHKKYGEQFGDDIRNRARLWYDGANRIAKHFAKEFGVTNPQASGVLAVFSPQKDWFQNVDMARRALDFWKKQRRMKWDDRMEAAFFKPRGKRTSSKSSWSIAERLPDQVPHFEAIKGKRFSEITDPDQQALWFRLHDEATNPRDYPVVTPEGDFGKWMLNDDGKTKASMAWSDFGPIKKAFSILNDGSRENISDSLGNEHKVRNFYNNILVPNSKNGHVTMDTHAIAAALVRALAGESDEVGANFGKLKGTSRSAYTGEAGTYFLAAEAYREAAKEVGLLPREMQSITWEAVRGMFTDRFKGLTKTVDGKEVKPNVEAIDKIWNDHLKGIVTREQARELAYAAAAERKPSKQGIDTPDWATDRGRVRGSNAPAGNPADTGAVLQRAGDRSRPGEGAGVGTGGESPLAVPAPGETAGRGRSGSDLPAGPLEQYALPRRDVHVGLKLGHGSPLHKQYGSDIAIPFEAADEVYNKLGKALNVKIKKRKNSQGIYEGVTEPSTHLTVTGKQNDIQDFLHAVSYALHQTMTISARPLKNGNGYSVDLVQRNGNQMADSEYAMRVAERIRQVAMEDPAYRRADGSHMFEEPAPWGTKSLVAGASAIDKDGKPTLRLYNDEGKFSQEQLAALSSIVSDKLGDEYAGLEFDLDHGDAEFKSAYNDWNENPNGENFKDQIIRRDGGLLQQYIDDHVRPLVDRAVDARSREEGARGEGTPAGAEAAATPEEVRYALSQRGQKPPPEPRLSDTIMDAAKLLRGGVNVNASQYDPADLAMAQKLAGDQRLDLDRLSKINPDEYLNFGKLQMEDRPKEHLRNMVRLAAHAGGWDPKQTVGFDEIKAEAKRMLGDLSILDIKKLQDKETLNPAVRLAYGIMLKNTEAEVVRRTQELSSNAAQMTPDQQLQAQRKIDVLDGHMRQLMDTLLPARSQDGRNLVYHRIVAQGGFNREYWNARVKRLLNLPPQAGLPDDVHRPLNDAITSGQIAEQEYNDAKQRMDEAQASGNQEAQAQGRTKLRDAEKKLNEAKRKLAQQAHQQEMTKLEAGMALWRAGLLTSPPSRALDILSNTAFHGLEKLTNIPETWLDAAMGQRTGQRSIGSQWKANALKETWQGMMEGAKQAKKTAADALKGKSMPDLTTTKRIEAYRQFNMGKGRAAKAAKYYHDLVYGMQSATDKPFGEAAYRMGIAEQANIEAINKHKSGTLPQGVSMAEYAQQLIDNPTDEMKTEADAMREFMTFTNDNVANDFISAGKQKVRAGKAGAKGEAVITGIVPFTKVPTNVLARVLEYSPVSWARAGLRAPKVAKGLIDKSLNQKDQRMFVQLMTRGTIGSAIQFLGLKLAEAGLMTGIRDDNDQGGKLADEAAGRPPSSIRIGNQWIQVPRISPFGNVLAAGATLYQNMHKLKDPASIGGAELGTVLKAVSDMPFLQGIDMVKDAIDSPGTWGTNYLKRLAGSVVPAGVARLAQSVDPVMRDLKDEGALSDLRSRIPFASKTLPARHDPLGKEMRHPGATRLGPLLDPFSTKTERGDDVTRAIVDNQLKLSKLEQGDSEPKALYNLRAQLTGEMQYRALLEALQSPEYQMAETAEERREALKDAKEAATREASGMTVRDEFYKQSSDEERKQMLEQYLENVRLAAPVQ